MQNTEIKLVDYDKVKDYVKRLKVLLKEDDVIIEEKRELIRAFIKQVKVNDKKIEIEYTIPVEAKKKCIMTKAG